MKKLGIAHTIYRCLLLAAAVSLFLNTPAWSAESRSAPESTNGFVHTQGEELVNASGKPLLLQGINLGNWFEVEGYMFNFEKGPGSPHEIEDLTRELLGPEKSESFWHEWRENYITEADMDRIKQAGFNSVRVPLHWKFFDSDDAEGFRLVDRLVQWAQKDGIYVILDLHCAPGGQTGSNIDDSLGYPWLYSSPEAQAHTVAVWRRIAKRYANNPTVLGYDLLNEPLPHYPKYRQFDKDLEPMYRKIAAGIREVDKNHVLILGGAKWDTDFSVFSGPIDKNMMWTFHLYWTKTTDASVMQQHLDMRAKQHVPIWCGETGENTDEWVQGFRQTLNANRVSWAFWTYKRMDTTRSVVSYAKPVHWDEIVEFAKIPPGMGDGEKRTAARPPQADIDAAFADLLKNIRFENEKENPGYIKALGLTPAQ